MNLKKRLLISFILTIIMPIIVTSASFWGFILIHSATLSRKYDITCTPADLVGNSVNLAEKYTDKMYEELKKISKESPADFLDKNVMAKYNSKLSKRYSYLFIIHNGNYVYTGKDEELSVNTKKAISSINSVDSNGYSSYIGDPYFILIKNIPFTIDSKEGAVYIITDMSNFSRESTVAIIHIVCVSVLGLIVTAFSLTMWIYKGILNPLRKLMDAAGNIRDGNLDFSVEYKSNDEFGELFNSFEDMRQRLKTSSEEKITYDKESKELISNISHDLKTPITAVKGYMEGIMDGVADTPEKMEKYIRTVYNKANEMDALINELTFYSKIDTNRIPYTFTKINVAQYFEDFVEETSIDLESKNIDLAYFNYVDTDTIIVADIEQLARVINNIIGNSVKYIDKPKGYINIRLKDVGEFIQVEIEDNGKGIAQKDIKYIFDRFYRTDKARNSTQGGSGIGLSIVRKIVEDHGGKIWATSKEGIGTVMCFVLKKYQEVPTDEQDIDS
ncbi:HAMP domain-containing protein [Acetitomaculum ruminis DSM 5522]|uniref:histidine kinase n=1 Tax=Acetitomaculum ruminis DSM 5522 TaxID=1120918 RepID=A0A1I0W3E2_9FIRM|nr:HAMP domain-containing sensor histidine kinase [Acetitomaculum ruminis]SFA82760.1 HAMP domain-containing protein [Acetitomaculum ruminis DSM 5522]